MKSKSQQAAQEFLEGPATEVVDEWDEMMALWQSLWAEEEENEA